MSINPQRAATIGLILFGLAYIAILLQYPYQSRIIPLIVSSLTVVVGIVQLLGSTLPALKPLTEEKGEENDEEHLLRDPQYRRRTTLIGGWILFFALLVYCIGYVIAVPLFMALFLIFMGRKGWVLVSSMTAGAALLTYLLIVVLLKFPWDQGVLWKLLG